MPFMLHFHGSKPQVVHLFLRSLQVMAFSDGLSRTHWPNTLPSAIIGHIPGREEAVGVVGCDCSL